MKKRCMMLVLMFLLLVPLAVNSLYADESSSESRSYVKAYYPSKAIARMVIKSFEPAPPEVNYDEGYLVIDVTKADITYLESLGFTMEAYTDYSIFNQQSAIPSSMLMTESALMTATSGIPGYTCYETVEETIAQAQSIVGSYPALAQLIDAGNSWQKENNNAGYDLWVLKLTSNIVSADKPRLFITSSIHAREYTTAPLSLAFANYLVNNYNTDADARWILDHNEIHLMLYANPDGRKKAEAGSLWRKNNDTNYCSYYKPGADLNRNFDFLWGGEGASTSQCDETYRGASAASEPETQAVQNYLKSIFNDYNGNSPYTAAPADASGLYIDIHSYSELVLWPWGDTQDTPPNGTQLQTLGRKFAFFNGYTPQQAIGLYPTTGTTDDYAYGELGIAAYCFELGTAFFQSCSDYENTILPDNLPALIYAAKVARTPYMTPAGPEVLNLSIGSDNLLSATINDTRYNNSNGTEGTQSIVAAKYYIDIAPWEALATPIELAATDANFNSSVEAVFGTIDVSNLSQGEHIVYVRGQDADGNFGPVSAVFLNVSDSNTPTANFTNTIDELTVQFTDTSVDNDGTIVSRLWNFGDSSSATDTNPVHTYAANGTYTVSLTITDNDDLVASTSKQVTVSEDTDATLLENNQTVTGMSGADGQWVYYKIVVPDGASNLVISTSGGSGDADLYTRFGDLPTSSAYDCRPYKSGNSETCTFASPESGTYYIGIYGYDAYSAMGMSVSYEVGEVIEELVDNQTVTDLFVSSKGDWIYYQVAVPSGTSSLQIVISGGTGDADLYVKSGALPTTSSYDCRPYRNGNEETCTISSPDTGTYYVGINAYSVFSGLSINANLDQ
ncbi:MAG: PKD domain-containing protein [Desulfobacteraceae bacterium]|nr:PKD domain-containing protein [Desulfobacteraceae bacterium]